MIYLFETGTEIGSLLSNEKYTWSKVDFQETSVKFRPGDILIIHQSYFEKTQLDSIFQMQQEVLSQCKVVLLCDNPEYWKHGFEVWLPLPVYKRCLVRRLNLLLGLRSPCILVAEDDLPVRKVIGRKLNQLGYDVVLVDNGREAIAQIFELFPELVILDNIRPELSGIKVTEWIGQNRYTRSIPSLIMSSLSDVQSVEDALNSGAVDYLFKPFDPVELERKVSFYFSRYYGNHKNVLILDDDTGMLKMIRNILHKNRFRVMVSSSSDEALSIAMQFKPDLIVTDYEMPGNGGWKFCRSLKQNSQTAEIPVVMISATFDELAMKRSRVLQVDGFVPKPFSPSSLLNSINMVLLQHDMQRQEKLSSELEKELTIGKEIQAGLMPASDIVVGGRLSISARWIPARYLGGDFFFVHEYSEHKVLVTVADVSGKGLSAALLATALQASLKTAVTFSDSPGVLLSSLNTYFLQDSSFEGFFLTAFLALIELDKNSIRYASAGHNKMLLQRGDGELKELSSQNIPCGFYEDEVYQELSDTFVPGDYLVLYSDGVTEAFNEKQEMYGLERLKSCLSEQNHRIAEKKLKNVMSSVQNFIGNAEAADDITLIVCGESVSS